MLYNIGSSCVGHVTACKTEPNCTFSHPEIPESYYSDKLAKIYGRRVTDPTKRGFDVMYWAPFLVSRAFNYLLNECAGTEIFS